MNLKSLVLIPFGLITLTLAACDHKGQHVQEGGSLAGLWMNEGSFDDFINTLNDQDRFCELVEAHAELHHPLDRTDRLARPRVLEVTPNGDVVRWLPKLTLRGVALQRRPVMGIDRLRLTGLNQMVRRGSDGEENFIRTQDNMIARYYRQIDLCDGPVFGRHHRGSNHD